MVRRIVFLGDRKDRIRGFPTEARARAGFELREVQKGNEPTDWKPITTVGPGVREIRLRSASGAFRVFFVLVVDDLVVVLHAFQKKTQKTPHRDIEMAGERLKAWRR